MNGPLVVKLGGSLFDWRGFPERLSAYLDERAAERLVLIAGGGPVTDIVRGLDQVHGLGQEASHHLALHSLDLTARLLAAVVPEARVIDRVEALDAAWARRHIPILAPRRFLARDDLHAPDPLPHHWEVTSDSIAARVAVHLGARELALLKSAPMPPGTDREGAARLGLVDPAFVLAARALARVSYLNLRAPRDHATLF